MGSLSRKFARASRRGLRLMEQYQQPGAYEFHERKYNEDLAKRRDRRAGFQEKNQ